MKDLQDFFEGMGYDKFIEMATLMEKKSLNNKSMDLLGGYISTVYCAEKNLDAAEIGDKEMQELWDSFFMNAAIYENVLKGHMEIIEGRITLTDSSCKFQLTEEGIKSVEEMLGR